MCASRCNSTSLAIWLESCSVPSKVFISFPRFVFPSASLHSFRALPFARERIHLRIYAFPGLCSSLQSIFTSVVEIHMKRPLSLFSLLVLPLACFASADDLFDIKPIGDGVYAAIAKPAYKPNCNAAIILLDDGVLVVDTHSKPSAARALIEQIKKLTDKPVRYVVNTHFHWDHYQGNQAYPSSWPAGVEII